MLWGEAGSREAAFTFLWVQIGMKFYFFFEYLFGCIGLKCSTQDFLLWRKNCLAVAWGLCRSMACNILVPWPGIEPEPHAWQGGFSTTGPPGNPRNELLKLYSRCLADIGSRMLLMYLPLGVHAVFMPKILPRMGNEKKNLDFFFPFSLGGWVEISNWSWVLSLATFLEMGASYFKIEHG